MEIKTKFNYDETVYFLKNNKIQEGKVAEMRITFTYSGYSGGWGSVAYPQNEEYAFDKKAGSAWDYIPAKLVFKTKEELLKSL